MLCAMAVYLAPHRVPEQQPVAVCVPLGRLNVGAFLHQRDDGGVVVVLVAESTAFYYTTEAAPLPVGQLRGVHVLPGNRVQQQRVAVVSQVGNAYWASSFLVGAGAPLEVGAWSDADVMPAAPGCRFLGLLAPGGILTALFAQLPAGTNEATTLMVPQITEVVRRCVVAGHTVYYNPVNATLLQQTVDAGGQPFLQVIVLRVEPVDPRLAAVSGDFERRIVLRPISARAALPAANVIDTGATWVGCADRLLVITKGPMDQPMHAFVDLVTFQVRLADAPGASPPRCVFVRGARLCVLPSRVLRLHNVRRSSVVVDSVAAVVLRTGPERVIPRRRLQQRLMDADTKSVPPADLPRNNKRKRADDEADSAPEHKRMPDAAARC